MALEAWSLELAAWRLITLWILEELNPKRSAMTRASRPCTLCRCRIRLIVSLSNMWLISLAAPYILLRNIFGTSPGHFSQSAIGPGVLRSQAVDPSQRPSLQLRDFDKLCNRKHKPRTPAGQLTAHWMGSFFLPLLLNVISQQMVVYIFCFYILLLSYFSLSLIILHGPGSIVNSACGLTLGACNIVIGFLAKRTRLYNFW